MLILKDSATAYYIINQDKKERMSMLEISLTNKNFEEEVLKEEKTVLVDFFATWCGPCKMLAPILSQIAEEYKDKVKIGKINVDEQGELALKYGISSIPTLILFKNGKVIKTSIGFKSKEEIEQMLNGQ